MLPEVEDKVLALREYIIRIARVKTGGRDLMDIFTVFKKSYHAKI